MRQQPLVLILFLMACEEPPTKFQDFREENEQSSQQTQVEEPKYQPAWVRIDRIIPEPGTVLERGKAYNLTVYYTAFRDPSDNFSQVHLDAYSEAPSAGIRQPALYPSANPMSRDIAPGKATSGSFVNTISGGPYSTVHPENPTGAQPTRMVVRLVVGRAFGPLIFVDASTEQVYAMK